MLFPQPYLPIGSKGPAVVVLQLLLLARNYNHQIIPDGDYGNETAKGVKTFQSLQGLDEDGNFGPQTRREFRFVTGIDVNAIGDLDGETTVSSGTLVAEQPLTENAANMAEHLTAAFGGESD